MIDSQGYRANVGIILVNSEGKLFWARRVHQNAWQFPQGGIKEGESAEQALFRELSEEIGLLPQHVSIISCTRDWLHYQLPEQFIRYDQKPLCIGQKQRWFLLRFKGKESDFCLNNSNCPEFDNWRWVDSRQPLEDIVEFKREVYQSALNEFSTMIDPV